MSARSFYTFLRAFPPERRAGVVLTVNLTMIQERCGAPSKMRMICGGHLPPASREWTILCRVRRAPARLRAEPTTAMMAGRGCPR